MGLCRHPGFQTWGNPIRFGLLYFGLVGFICTLVCPWTCTFYFYKFSIYDSVDEGMGDFPDYIKAKGAIGLFRYYDDEESACFEYDKESSIYLEHDSWLTFSRIAVTFAGVAAFVAFCAVILELSVFTFGRCGKAVITGLYLHAAVAQALAFYVYKAHGLCGSEMVECSMSSGSYLSIAASFCYLICMIVTLIMPESQPYCHRRNRRSEQATLPKDLESGQPGEGNDWASDAETCDLAVRSVDENNGEDEIYGKPRTSKRSKSSNKFSSTTADPTISLLETEDDDDDNNMESARAVPANELEAEFEAQQLEEDAKSRSRSGSRRSKSSSSSKKISEDRESETVSVDKSRSRSKSSSGMRSKSSSRRSGSRNRSSSRSGGKHHRSRSRSKSKSGKRDDINDKYRMPSGDMSVQPADDQTALVLKENSRLCRVPTAHSEGTNETYNDPFSVTNDRMSSNLCGEFFIGATRCDEGGGM